MKVRAFLMWLIGSLMAVTSYAGDEITLKSGNLAVFLLQENVELEIDYSKAKVNGYDSMDAYLESRGADFVKDWPNDAVAAKNYFIAQFNKKNKKGMQIAFEGQTKYKLVLQLSSLDMGSAGANMAPFASAKAGGVIASGLMEVVDVATNKSVCCIEVNEVKGFGHVSETVRLGMCYWTMASKILKLAKKADASAELALSDRLTGK